MTESEKKLVVSLAGVVSTLGETTKAGGTVIASMIYLALGSDHALYTRVVGAGVRLGWLTATPERIGLTPAGREKAEAFRLLGV